MPEYIADSPLPPRSKLLPPEKDGPYPQPSRRKDLFFGVPYGPSAGKKVTALVFDTAPGCAETEPTTTACPLARKKFKRAKANNHSSPPFVDLNSWN
jgi:hypothetical protein